jgi:hypothetical protein
MIAAIGQLYAVESRAKEMTATERGQLRQTDSQPVLERIQELLHRHLHAVAPNSLLGKALHYMEGQWPKLIRYVDNGAWPIDNNLCHAASGMTKIMPTPGLCRVISIGSSLQCLL